MSHETNMTKLQKKIKKLFPEFPEVVDGLSVTDLEEKMLTYAKETQAVSAKLQEMNEEGQPIHLAKQAVSELTRPFSDIKKALDLKNAYIHALIGEKGGKTGGSSM